MKLFKSKIHEHNWDVDHPQPWVGDWGFVGYVGQPHIKPQLFAVQLTTHCKTCTEIRMLLWRIFEKNTGKQIANLDGQMEEPEWLKQLERDILQQQRALGKMQQ